MTEGQIRRLNVSVVTAMKSLTRLGVGSKELFEGQSELVRDKRAVPER
jgi:hypothetical protein